MNKYTARWGPAQEVETANAGPPPAERRRWNGLTPPPVSVPATAAAVECDYDAIVAWCKGHLTRELDVPPEALDPHVPLVGLGVDSATAASLVVEIEERYEVSIELDDIVDEEMSIAGIGALLCERLGPTEVT